MSDELPGDEDIIKGTVGTLAWETAFSRILAHLWEGDIVSTPKGSTASEANPANKSIYDWTPEDTRVMVKKLTGYEVIDSLNLTFLEYEGEQNFDPNLTVKGEPANGWARVSKEEINGKRTLYNNVSMVLPPTPNSQQASALADYMALGMEYPFTCITP